MCVRHLYTGSTGLRASTQDVLDITMKMLDGLPKFIKFSDLLLRIIIIIIT